MISPKVQKVLDLTDAVIRTAGDLTRIGDSIASQFGQTGARTLVLGAIAAQSDSIAGVARRRGLRRQSVQETMRRLEGDGLVQRDSHGNRRSPTFTLTPSGEQVRKQAHAQFVRWARSIASEVTTDEVDSALMLLHRMSTNGPYNL